MTKSFFGGQRGVSHFHAHPPIKPNYRTKEEGLQRKAEAKELREKIIAAGFPNFGDRYFQFHDNSPAEKALAKNQCEAYAAQIEVATGIKLTAMEGCFL